jgi:hypothetical protein
MRTNENEWREVRESMAELVYELLAVGAYLLGMVVGAYIVRFHGRMLGKASLFGVLTVYVGATVNFLPLCYLGCFLSCLFVGAFLDDVGQDLWRQGHYVRDLSVVLGGMVVLAVLTLDDALQKLTSKLQALRP